MDKTDKVNKTDNTDNIDEGRKFPYKLVLIASLLGGCFLYFSSIKIINMEAYHTVPFWAAFGGTFIVIIIPILIAYIRQLKTRDVVYWLAVIGAFIPLGLLLIILTILYSLLAERKWIWLKKLFAKKNTKIKTNTKVKNNSTRKVSNKSNKQVLKIIYFAIIFISIICLYSIKTYNEEKEELSLSLFDKCEKSHSEFVKEMAEYTTSSKALANLNEYNKGWKKRCKCEVEAIFSLHNNPYSKLKFAKYAVKHYDNWQTYYKEINPKLMWEYKKNEDICIHRNTNEKIYYDNGKLKIEKHWDNKGKLNEVCYDGNGKKTPCYIIHNILNAPIIIDENKNTVSAKQNIHDIAVKNSADIFKYLYQKSTPLQKKYINDNSSKIKTMLKAHGYFISTEYKYFKWCMPYYLPKDFQNNFNEHFKNVKQEIDNVLAKAFGNGNISYLDNQTSKLFIDVWNKEVEDDYNSVMETLDKDNKKKFNKTVYCKLLDVIYDRMLEQESKFFIMNNPYFANMLK